MISPLITYPYLVRVLGKELYGLVITAQVLASFFSIFIDFGFKSVSARHISINRNNTEKLSEILSSIIIVRVIIWFISLVVYTIIIGNVSTYRGHFWLFIFAYGITFNELLFPQFFFQGIEKMKYISIIRILIKSIFIILTFFVVKDPAHYYVVPLLTSIGYFIGGVIAIIIIFKFESIRFKIPKREKLIEYSKDAFPIFLTDVICSIKDKFNYIILGSMVGMSEVVIYDLGAKLNKLIVQPMGIIKTVLFPKIAKERNVKLFLNSAALTFFFTLSLVIVTNIFLPQIVKLFLNDHLETLLPIRLFLITPLVLTLSSYIAGNLLIAFGYNKYILYSIIITTVVYLGSLIIFYSTNRLNNVTVFVGIALASYTAEFIYRVFKSIKILNYERIKTNI
jgi:PST family polysaccharide transporter